MAAVRYLSGQSFYKTLLISPLHWQVFSCSQQFGHAEAGWDITVEELLDQLRRQISQPDPRVDLALALLKCIRQGFNAVVRAVHKRFTQRKCFAEQRRKMHVQGGMIGVADDQAKAITRKFQPVGGLDDEGIVFGIGVVM